MEDNEFNTQDSAFEYIKYRAIKEKRDFKTEFTRGYENGGISVRLNYGIIEYFYNYSDLSLTIRATKNEVGFIIRLYSENHKKFKKYIKYYWRFLNGK